MPDFLNTLSTLILLSSVLLMANKRAKSYIKTFRLQSVLIVLASGVRNHILSGETSQFLSGN